MPPAIDLTILQQNTRMVIEPSKTNRQRRLHEVGTLWDQSKFSLGHTPLVIEDIEYPDHIILNTRVLDLPIKVPGDHKVTLPTELQHAHNFCKKVLDYVYSTSPKQYEATYAYLTVDEGMIPPRRTQRHEGLHVDGFQGDRIGDALPVDFSFICWFGEGAPTKFYPYGFDCEALDRAKDNFSQYWTQSAQRRSLKPYHARKNTIYGMDAYTIHESGINETNNSIYGCSSGFLSAFENSTGWEIPSTHSFRWTGHIMQGM